jgi:hypothetical protein
MATAEPGARPRPVSIACRYVRTHAMELSSESSMSTVERVWTLQETRRASLKPAKPLSVSYDDDITLFRSSARPACRQFIF